MGPAIPEQALGHAFGDPSLLAQALTHRSAGRPNNERLEFLGDALVNLLVAELIYELHPKASEGEMTRLRAALVNGEALAGQAREAGLGERLRLGSGELKSGGWRRATILADAFEAVIGAIYLDAGWETCRLRVRERFEAAVREGVRTPKDAKTRLQEWLQGRARPVPVYELAAVHGPDHARIFDVTCHIEGEDTPWQGSGSSRRAAEQQAAEQALAALEENHGRS